VLPEEVARVYKPLLRGRSQHRGQLARRRARSISCCLDHCFVGPPGPTGSRGPLARTAVVGGGGCGGWRGRLWRCQPVLRVASISRQVGHQTPRVGAPRPSTRRHSDGGDSNDSENGNKGENASGALARSFG